jgi:hypothetical protein
VSRTRITVGVPVYKGADLIPGTLRCLQEQTFTDFEVIISVDGNDEETAEACRPFLSDSRFRMDVQAGRLDWFGNFNWLLRQEPKEFFCFRQHDDTTSPNFFEVLIKTADARPNAAAVYSDCQWTGTRSDLEIAPSIEGNPQERLVQFIEGLNPVPVRGLIRREAIDQAGPIRSDEFRALTGVFTWLAKIARWGDFIRVPEPLYYKLDHANNYHKHYLSWPHARLRESWTTMFTGLLEAAMPICRTPEERLFCQQLIVDRVSVYRSTRPYIYCPPHFESAGKFMAECLARLKHEGNEHLLAADDLPNLLQTAFRVEALRAKALELEGDLGTVRAELERARGAAHPAPGTAGSSALGAGASRWLRLAREQAWPSLGLGRKLAPLPDDFDDERYLELNPDVRAAKMDARRHYRLHGARESRRYK